MVGQKKIALLMISLIMTWLESVPYYGDVYRIFVKRSGLSQDIAQTVFVSFYFIFVVVFCLLAKEGLIKRMTFAGTAACLGLTLAGWFIPVLQSAYVLHALLGVSAALLSIAFCFVFIYSFDPSTRVKATAAFEAVTCFCVLSSSLLLFQTDGNLGFGFTCLILILLLFLSRRFDPGVMTSPGSIEEKPVPVKLVIVSGIVIFIIYLNSGFEYNMFLNASSAFEADVPGFGFLVKLLETIVYGLFFFFGSRINRFGLVYATLIALGLSNLFGVLLPRQALPAVIFTYLSTCASNIFIFAFMGDISLKYGRNFKTAGFSLLACGVGSILGEYLGKWSVDVLSERAVPAFATALAAVFISFLIVPWLAKYINDEMRSIHKSVTGGETGDGQPRESETGEHGRIKASYQASLQDLLRKACLSLPDGNELTPREFEIAALLLERNDNGTIAAKLFISQNTLKVHIRRIYQKFQVSRRKEFYDAVEFAERRMEEG